MAMISVINADRLTSERTDAFGPEPSVIRFIGKVASQFFLQVRVIGAVDETQDEVCAAQLSVAIVTKEQYIVGFFIHVASLTKSTHVRPLPLTMSLVYWRGEYGDE